MVEHPRPQEAQMRKAGRLLMMMSAGALGVVLAIMVGIAVAKSLTLQEAKNATVTNFNTHKSKQENIVVAGGGFAVYELSGDSKSHPKCTMANGCFRFWPPVTIAAGKKPTKAAAIKGKLGIWKRDGFVQVTLSGHPLYFFSVDKHKRHAMGQDVMSFGGTWHVTALGQPAGHSTTVTTGTAVTPPPYTMPTGTTTTTTNPSPPYPYPYSTP
jgi:predicted lipoprotein with Yx(FWY)xxD motif